MAPFSDAVETGLYSAKRTDDGACTPAMAVLCSCTYTDQEYLHNVNPIRPGHMIPLGRTRAPKKIHAKTHNSLPDLSNVWHQLRQTPDNLTHVLQMTLPRVCHSRRKQTAHADRRRRASVRFDMGHTWLSLRLHDSAAQPPQGRSRVTVCFHPPCPEATCTHYCAIVAPPLLKSHSPHHKSQKTTIPHPAHRASWPR